MVLADQTWLTSSQRQKGTYKPPSTSVLGEAQFALFGVSLQFSSAFASVCLWLSLTPVMMAGPARLSELGAQAGAPSHAHSLLIHVHQGFWTKGAACPAAEAGDSPPGLPSSFPSSQHTRDLGPGSCSPSFSQWGENRTDKHPFSEQVCFKSSKMKHFASWGASRRLCQWHRFLLQLFAFPRDLAQLLIVGVNLL